MTIFTIGPPSSRTDGGSIFNPFIPKPLSANRIRGGVPARPHQTDNPAGKFEERRETIPADRRLSTLLRNFPDFNTMDVCRLWRPAKEMPRTGKRTIERAQAALGDRNIILTGFMGSGKTTVGRILARNLGWEFLDTDREIESREGRTIPEIFEKPGEEAFREMETRLAGELPEMHRKVIATGGGFMVRPENREFAAQAGPVVLLIATPEQIWHRVKRSRHRPLLRTADPEGRIRELLHQRKDAYASIPIRVETGGKTPYSIAEDVLKALIPE